jgi:hypothetical protein
MDPDLAITICFVSEVFLFALAFTLFAVHESHKVHAASAAAPERRNRRKGIG